MKILVAYYSLEGNTRFIASAITNELGADMFEVKPVKDIKPSGTKYLWGGRQAMMKSKPDLEPIDINPDDYDLIFLGSPVWAFTFTPAIRSFLDKYPLKGKKMALFITHEGGPKETLAKLEKAVEGNSVIGRKDFLNVLKEEPEKKQKEAREWARGLA